MLSEHPPNKDLIVDAFIESWLVGYVKVGTIPGDRPWPSIQPTLIFSKPEEGREDYSCTENSDGHEGPWRVHPEEYERTGLSQFLNDSIRQLAYLGRTGQIDAPRSNGNNVTTSVG